jgi:hypothetical protein
MTTYANEAMSIGTARVWPIEMLRDPAKRAAPRVAGSQSADHLTSAEAAVSTANAPTHQPLRQDQIPSPQHWNFAAQTALSAGVIASKI